MLLGHTPSTAGGGIYPLGKEERRAGAGDAVPGLVERKERSPAWPPGDLGLVLDGEGS